MDFEKRKTSNYVTEYERLLANLRAAAGFGIQWLVLRGDSQLVVNEVCKEYDFPWMKAYVEEVRKLELQFKGLQMEHIPRGENFVMDELSKIASRR